MKVTDLRGQAKEHFEYWRYQLGLSEADALRRVEESGVVAFEQLRETFESTFRRLGYTEENAKTAAWHAACGRQGPPETPDLYERQVQTARNLGLSEAGAQAFARGRNFTETEARQAYADAAKLPGSGNLRESATIAPVRLVESARLVEAAGGKPTATRFRARLIAGDTQGSSGFYPAQMLRESAGAFHKDLPVYLDHPSASEAYERPERSVRDLAGRLVETARYEGDGLYSTIEIFPHMVPMVESLADFIGLSIRASGEVKPSVSESIRGPIVTAITSAQSVDLVTAAGAGGRLMKGAA